MATVTPDHDELRLRRASARRTAWVIAGIALVVYGGFLTMPWWK